MHQFLIDARQTFREDQRPLLEEHRRLIEAQREERERLDRLQQERRICEDRERQARIRTGIRGLLDFVIGRAANIRRINDREALEGAIRDRDQREAVVIAQLAERQELQSRIDDLRRDQRSRLMAMGRAVGRSLSGAHRATERVTESTTWTETPSRTLKPRTRKRDRGFDFGL